MLHPSLLVPEIDKEVQLGPTPYLSRNGISNVGGAAPLRLYSQYPYQVGMGEETAPRGVGAFCASESIPVLVSIPRPRTITITNRSKVRAI